MKNLAKGLEKLERRRRLGLLWKWKRSGVSHEVTIASRDSRRKIQDRMDAAAGPSIMGPVSEHERTGWKAS